MKKWHSLVLALSFVALIAAAGFLYTTLKDSVATDQLMALPAQAEPTSSGEAETTGTEPAQDTTAPDFTVYDPEGNPVSLESLRGKPVILNFWATWCGYCVMEMPEFQAVFDQYGDQIHFMMINVTDGYQETQKKAEAFIAEEGFSFPVYYDLQLTAASAYRVDAMPVTYFIDKDGQLIAYGSGALDAPALLQGIGMILDN